MVKLEIFTHQGASSQLNMHDKNQKLKHTRAFVRGLDSAQYTLDIYDYNKDPQAYAENAEVRNLLAEHGDAALPVILIDGSPVCWGSYPTNDKLADLLRIGCTGRDEEDSICCR